jgi:ribosomal protein S6--L-glutamate ligase
MGVPALNGAQPIAIARDKLEALQVLTEHRIAVPETVMVRRPRDLRVALDSIGGVPAILKLLQGTQGIGVMIVDSVQAAESVLDAFWSLGQNILLQKYYSVSREAGDLRAFVVGGDVVALMRRKTASGEFRSNIHRGAVGIPVHRPDPEVLRVARAATAAVGLEVAGVDLLESEDGPLVLELNPTPGLEGIEKATGEDIAGRVLERAERLAARVRV